MKGLHETMKILTANTLRDGSVVYWGADGWKSTLRDALVSNSEECDEQLLCHGNAQMKSGQIVEPYLIDVERDEGSLSPLHYRENIRALGPTILSQRITAGN